MPTLGLKEEFNWILNTNNEFFSVKTVQLFLILCKFPRKLLCLLTTLLNICSPFCIFPFFRAWVQAKEHNYAYLGLDS